MSDKLNGIRTVQRLLDGAGMLSLMGSIHVLCYLAGSASGKDGSILPTQNFLLFSYNEKFSFPVK